MDIRLTTKGELVDGELPRTTLTAELRHWLRSANQGATVSELELVLRQQFPERLVFLTSEETSQEPFFSTPHTGRALAILQDLLDDPVRQAIAHLREAITVREQQGDPWPEGRLNLGIAYAQVGDYDQAQRWLTEAVNFLRYPDYGHRAEMAA